MPGRLSQLPGFLLPAALHHSSSQKISTLRFASHQGSFHSQQQKQHLGARYHSQRSQAHGVGTFRSRFAVLYLQPPPTISKFFSLFNSVELRRGLCSGAAEQRNTSAGPGPAVAQSWCWRWLLQSVLLTSWVAGYRVAQAGAVWDDAVWPAAGVGSYEVENIMSSGQGKFPLEVVTDNNLLRQRYEDAELEGKLPLYVTRNSAQGVVKVNSGADVLAVSALPTPAAPVRLKDAAAAVAMATGTDGAAICMRKQ